MSKYNVSIIVGSLRKDSHNLKLAKAIARLGKEKFDINFLKIDALPLFNQDLESDFPLEALRLKKEVKCADALLIVTPEYNRGVTAALKNAVDWLSRPYGDNSLKGVPTALCGTSLGKFGTVFAQNSLRITFNLLDVKLMTKPEVYLQFKDGLIDENGVISESNTEDYLKNFVESFYNWISISV